MKQSQAIIAIASRACYSYAIMFRIGPVPPNQRRKAIDFIAAGAAKGRRQRVVGDILNAWASRLDAGRTKLWWATRLLRPVAAVILVESPGRAGMIVFSSSTAPGVRHDALVELLRTVTENAIAGGLAIVQSQQETNREEDIAVLSEVGYLRLAELIYMELHLNDFDDAGDSLEQPQIAWRNYDEFSEPQLAELIAATYIDSLDCPAIVGRRNISDVIATHKSGGIFLPQSWWILECAGRPAGCVLVNDASDSENSKSSEVVYMGVAPEFRGRGFGKMMINRAAADARRRKRRMLTLAVDSHNTPAKCVYNAAGFVETARRLICVAIQK